MFKGVNDAENFDKVGTGRESLANARHALGRGSGFRCRVEMTGHKVSVAQR